MALPPPEPSHPTHGNSSSASKRGQASGAFNPDLPVAWMLTVLLELIHASSRELATGRLPEDKAEPR